MHNGPEEFDFRISGEQLKVIIPVSIIFIILIVILVTIHIFEWWTLLGLLALKFGLGVKVKGATTVAGAILKAGGKKAVAVTTFGMFFKRHVIDLFGKFFAEHSVSRYKKNILNITKVKFGEILNSSPVQRAKAVGTTLLSIPILYFVWAKVITTGVQKIAYAIVYPVVTVIWTFLVNSFGAASNFIGFLFQVFALNWVITKLERYTWGKKIIRGIDLVISFLGDAINYINKAFIWLGFDPKHKMIVWSIRLNRYLEGILDKGLNTHKTLKIRRERHITAREALISQRISYKDRRVKHKSLWKKTKGLYRTKVKKKLTWQEKREKRKNK